MRARLALLVTTTVVLAVTSPQSEADEAARPAPRLRTLQAHVEYLAGDALMGRGAWEHRKQAADYIAKQFADAGLVTVPGMDSMFLDHDVRPKFEHCRNVVAWLPGKLAGETKEAPGDYVMLTAHYDHLGFSRAPNAANPDDPAPVLHVFHGADDNASGVAAMLEIAHLLGADAKAGRRLDRSVVFVAFDLEEQFLVGSRKYVEESPLPLDRLRAFVTIDQLGRSIADVAPGALFLMGIENSESLRKALDPLSPPEHGQVLPLGIDFQPGYSDYVAFKERKIPYVFVTSGACGDYHLVTDRAERVQWSHMLARTAYCRELVTAIADGDKQFTWHDELKPHPKEMERLGVVIADVAAHLEERGLPAAIKVPLDNFHRQILRATEDGEVTKEERTAIRNLALMMFRMATQMQAQK